MSNGLKIDQTTDSALVQMGGLHVYLQYEPDSIFHIDKAEFEVIHTEYEHPTGFGALTIPDLELLIL